MAPRLDYRASRASTVENWGGWIRTSDFLINSQALCQLSYTPKKARASRGGADVEN